MVRKKGGAPSFRRERLLRHVQMGNESRRIAEQRFDVRLVNRIILQTMKIGNEAGSIVEKCERGIICPSDEKVD